MACIIGNYSEEEYDDNDLSSRVRASKLRGFQMDNDDNCSRVSTIRGSVKDDDDICSNFSMNRRFQLNDDDNRSRVSTIRSFQRDDCCSTYTSCNKTIRYFEYFLYLRYIKSKMYTIFFFLWNFCNSCINSESSNEDEKEIYRCNDFDTNSDDLVIADRNEFDDENLNQKNKSQFKRKSNKIDNSPEAEQKRREVYNKWLRDVNAREREKKRLQKEKLEAELEKKWEEEEARKLLRDEKVNKWHKKKENEAQKKITHMSVMKQVAEEKIRQPKEFKKAINFQDWLTKKNHENIQGRKTEEKNRKISEESLQTTRKNRESKSTISYEKWKEMSKNTAKPVPLNRGLKSLRGSTTKIYVNPIPWKDIVEEAH